MDDDFLMDYWAYNLIWEDRDIFDPNDDSEEEDDACPFSDEELERMLLEQRDNLKKLYDNNGSKGNSREY